MATEQLRRREGESLVAAAAIEKAVRESLPAGSKEDAAHVEGLVKEALAALAGAGVTQEELAAGAEYIDKYREYDPAVRIAGGRITGPRAFPCGATHTFEADAPGPAGPNEGRAIRFSPKPNFLDTNFYTLEAIVGPLTRITYYSKTDKNDHLTGLWLGVLSPPLPPKEKFSGPGRFKVHIII